MQGKRLGYEKHPGLSFRVRGKWRGKTVEVGYDHVHRKLVGDQELVQSLELALLRYDFQPLGRRPRDITFQAEEHLGNPYAIWEFLERELTDFQVIQSMKTRPEERNKEEVQ